jgi:hypothetical protein
MYKYYYYNRNNYKNDLIIEIDKHIENKEFKSAIDTGFYRLFNYISGNNVPKQKVDMTAPVLTRLTPGQGPACNSTFIISFFIPYKYQNNNSPPKPNPNSNVYIETINELKVGVTSFGGYVKSFETVGDHYKQLLKQVNDHGHQPKQLNEIYVAQYDSPFRLFDRHNEVWIELK